MTLATAMKEEGRFDAMPKRPYVDRYAPPSDLEVRRLQMLIDVVQIIRKQEPKMTTSYLVAFLAVAMDPGKGPTAYAERLGTIQPVMSRVLLEIGKKARSRETGALGLVDSEPDPGNLRQHRYFLTEKGRELFKMVMDRMAAFEQAALPIIRMQ
jgi:DNA-binding MarR family transcriptional regulator